MESKLKTDDFYNQISVDNLYYSDIKVFLLDCFLVWDRIVEILPFRIYTRHLVAS